MEIKKKCLKCGEVVTLYQDDNHSEYAPYGRCNNCSREYVAILDGMKVKLMQISSVVGGVK